MDETSGLDWALSPSMATAYGWFVAVLFSVLQVGLGRRIRSWAGEQRGSSGRPEEILVSFVVGFWFSTLVAFILVGAGLLSRTTVGIYLLGALAISWQRDLLADLSPRRYLRRLWSGEPGKLVIIIGSCTLFLLPFLLRTLVPNSDWDGASTHLPFAHWLLERGLQPVSLDYSNLILPGNVHLIYSMFLAIGAETGILPLNLLVSLLTCAAAGVLAGRFWGKAAGLWALGVALSTPLILAIGQDPRIDGFLAFFCTMAAFGVMTWIMEGQERRRLILVGIALGCALGTKYTAVFPLALWCPPMVAVGLWQWRTKKVVDRLGTALALAALLVPSGYRYLSNTVRFEDPVYPLLNGNLTTSRAGGLVSVDTVVDELLLKTERDESFRVLLRQVEERQAEYQPPGSLFESGTYLTSAREHARKPGHTLSPLLLLSVLLPILARGKAGWLLLWLGLSTFIAIGTQTYLVRYGLVAYPLLAAGAGVVLAGVRKRWWQIGWAAALLAVVALNLSVEWQQVRRHRVAAWLSGEETRIEWLQQVGYNGSTELPGMIREIRAGQQDGSVPMDGEILMLGEAKFHLLGFQALPDISRTAVPWLAYLTRNNGDLDGVHHDLWDRGVRYLLVNLGYFSWVAKNVEVDTEEYVLSLWSLQEFMQSRGSLSIGGPGIVLIRIRPPDPIAFQQNPTR